MQINLRTKITLYVALMILGFALFDVGSLKAIHAQLKASDLDYIGLAHASQALFKAFLIKGLWLVISIGLAIGFGYWALKPYLDKEKAQPPQEGKHEDPQA